MKRKQKRRRFDGPIHGRIAALREAAGLSQSELAEKVGVDLTAVSHWENRTARPQAERLPAIAAALGVTVDELFREAA